MRDHEIQSVKKKLIEKLGVYFEKEKHLSPLAARILSILTLVGKFGISFEDLVADLEASKSTIWTHLSSLIGQQKVSYYTKTGDRKRYFILGPNYIVRKIEELKAHWNSEIELLKQVIAYKEDFNQDRPSDEKLELTFHQETVKFLTGSIEYLEKQKAYYQSKDN